MDAQSYRDHCLIIVGSGSAAELLLARRRLRAGGRLVHLQIAGQEDKRLHVSAFDDLECFWWFPPRGTSSDFGKRLGVVTFHTRWTTTGVASIHLRDDQQVQIFRASGKMRHVRILSAENNIEVEISGEVILNPDLQTAATLDVEVADPDPQ